MKRVFIMALLSVMVVVMCGKKEKTIRLKEGTPAYALAEGLSEIVPAMDPNENRVLISTNRFDMTTGEVIQTIQSSSGNQSQQLLNMPPERVRTTIAGLAEDLAVKKLLLLEAKEAKISVSQADVDSILSTEYSYAGGKEQFEAWLERTGISLDYVKEDAIQVVKINRYLRQVLGGPPEVTDEEIEEAYQEDQTATVRHILLRTQGKGDSAREAIRQEMETILERAKKGENFAELAKQYSEDPGSKANGGLYENFNRGTMEKPFEEAAFSVPVGGLSDVFETRYGYHILKVIERNKETRPLEHVRPVIEAQLMNEKQKNAYEVFVEQLKQDDDFQMLPF